MGQHVLCLHGLGRGRELASFFRQVGAYAVKLGQQRPLGIGFSQHQHDVAGLGLHFFFGNGMPVGFVNGRRLRVSAGSGNFFTQFFRRKGDFRGFFHAFVHAVDPVQGLPVVQHRFVQQVRPQPRGVFPVDGMGVAKGAPKPDEHPEQGDAGQDQHRLADCFLPAVGHKGVGRSPQPAFQQYAKDGGQQQRQRKAPQKTVFLYGRQDDGFDVIVLSVDEHQVVAGIKNFIVWDAGKE